MGKTLEQTGLQGIVIPVFEISVIVNRAKLRIGENKRSIHQWSVEISERRQAGVLLPNVVHFCHKVRSELLLQPKRCLLLVSVSKVESDSSQHRRRGES